MKGLIARYCIDFLQEKRNLWIAGLSRTVRIGTLMLAVCVLVVGSSNQYKQVMQEQKSTSTVPAHKETGQASWYGPGFQGQETASGEIFDTNEMTAAHPSLPLGTKVEVTNLEKNKKVEVRINDRGPYVKGRVIDLSRAAAKKLSMIKKGTTKVKVVAKAVKKKPAKKKRPKSGSHKCIKKQTLSACRSQ